MDNVEGMKQVEDDFFNLVITSPPYADMRKYKNFQGIRPDKYVEWFIPRAEQIKRILKDDGSFILNINDKVVDGFRSTYVFRLVIAMEDLGLKLWERFFWYKRNPMPGMGGKRFRDSTEYLFLFAKNKPRIFMDAVKVPSIDKRSRENAQYGISRSGHNTTLRETSSRFPDMVVPTNILDIPLGAISKDAESHIAIFPEKIPEFFLNMTTLENDNVLDPFFGSGTTGKVCTRMNRNWMGFDNSQEYCDIAKRRIDNEKNKENK